MKNLFDRSPAENFRKVMRRFQATCRNPSAILLFPRADGVLLIFMMLPLRLLQAIEPSPPNYPMALRRFLKFSEDLGRSSGNAMQPGLLLQALKWRI